MESQVKSLVEGTITHVGGFESPVGGEKIFYKRILPEEFLKNNEKILHYVIVHGATEYHNRHQALIEFLLRKNPGQVAITCIDLKGHGQSGGGRSYINFFDEFCSDLVHLCNTQASFYEKFDNKVSHFMIGHSMGGLVCLKTLMQKKNYLRFPISGVVLSNPFLKEVYSVPQWVYPLMNKMGTYLPKLRVKNVNLGKDLTRDHDKAKEYDRDPLISHFMTLGLIKEVLESASNVRTRPYYVKFPCFFILSGQDKVADYKATKAFACGIDKNMSDVKIYQNSYHEAFNDINREEVFEDLYKWTLKRS